MTTVYYTNRFSEQKPTDVENSTTFYKCLLCRIIKTKRWLGDQWYDKKIMQAHENRTVPRLYLCNTLRNELLLLIWVLHILRN